MKEITIISIVSSLIWALFSATLSAATVSAVKGGEIDLKSWSPDHHLSLDGAWYVFPNELIDPDHIVDRLRTATIPKEITSGKSFSQLFDTHGTPNHGSATYAIYLRNLPIGEKLALVPGTVFSASEIILLDAAEPGHAISLVRIGQPGLNATEARSGVSRSTFVELPKSKNAILMIHASNFHHTWGGLWTAPTLGSLQTIKADAESKLNANYLSLGILLFIAFFSLSLFLHRREDKGSLWLTLLALAFSVRSFNYIGGFFEYLPESWHFAFYLKVIYITMILNATISFSFLRCYFPKQFSKGAKRLLDITMYPTALAVALAPNSIFGYFGYPLVYVGGAITLWAVINAFRALLDRETGSLVCSLGIIGVFIGAGLEFIGALGVIRAPTNALIYGINFFVMFQTQIVVENFVKAFRNSEHLSRELKKEVDQQTREIRSILDNIKQGIFTLVKGATVGPQYSNFTKTILENDNIEGKGLDQLLLDHSTFDSDLKDQIHNVIMNVLGEHVINFEANCAALPHEIVVDHSNGRVVLEVDWSPMINEQEDVEKILICLRDVTEVRQLRLEAEKNQRDLLILQEVIQIPEDKFVRFFRKAQELLIENKTLIQSDASGMRQNCKRIFVNYHTLKGTARTYQLRTLASQTHNAESQLADIMKGKRAWQQDEMLDDLHQVCECLRSYNQVAIEKLHWNLEKQTVTLKKEEMIELLPLIQDLGSEVNSNEGKNKLATLNSKIMEHCYTKVHNVILEAVNGLDSLARDLGKAMPELVIKPSNYFLIDEWADKFYGILTHILRNSIDHGLETPEERKAAGKRNVGNIFIEVDVRDEQLRIAIQDDGRGLDLPKIQEKGEAQGLLTNTEPSDHEIAQLIFSSGLSTKTEVSEISGRGVGMDAVRSYMEEGGGGVLLSLDETFIDRHHVPFTIELFLPSTAWIADAGAVSSVAA